MTEEERKTRAGSEDYEIDDYLKGSMPVPTEDENENYQFYASIGTQDYHVHDREEMETDEQYLHFLMDLPLDEKAKLYELWEQSLNKEQSQLAKAADEKVKLQTITIAGNLLKWGMDPADIVKVTGLTAEQVEQIRQGSL